MKGSRNFKPSVEEAKPSIVPPIIAALISALIPGLGQILSRKSRRGITLLVSFISIVGLLAWRIRLAARYDNELWEIIAKSFKLQPYLIAITAGVVLLYLWIIYDAYQSSRQRFEPLGIFGLVVLVFFALGWQIGEINLVKLITSADNAGPAIMKIVWPWDRAVDYPEEMIVGIAEVISPCLDEPFTPAPAAPGSPILTSEPTCGLPSEQNGASGTEISIHGEGFQPGELVAIWWADPIGNEFRQRQGGEYIQVMPDETGAFDTTIVFPYRLLPPSARDQAHIWEIQARQVASISDPIISSELKLVVEKMVETIIIGMMATLFGIILALPLSFVAARNLMSGSNLTIALYYLVRAILNIIRSIEPLIWAIIFVIIVGLGPYAGILALSLHSAAALGKLYSESIESIDHGPIEAIQATGANWLQVVMFAVVPQIVPPFISFTIYRWDINIRMSTIIGFVGGGGIGFLLAQWIRLLDYSAAGLAVWFIAVTVAILDYVSAEIRARYI